MKEKEVRSIEKWLKLIGNPKDVSLVIVPPPKWADQFQVTGDPDLVQILIWKLPPEYKLD